MVIKVVDLGCEKCHKKIKRVLCAIPQIQNQTYDQKKNTVTITVVGCCPEKIKKKIYCKGGECVKCIEIPPPPSPSPLPPPPPPPPPPCTCGEKCRRGPCCHQCCMPTPPAKCHVPCRRSECDRRSECHVPSPPCLPPPCPPPCLPPPPPCPPPCLPPPPPPPPCTCCEKCRRGPCCHHFCMPTPPAKCHVPCRRSECDIWGDGCCSCRSRGYYVCRSVYVCEEYYPSAPCTIM